MTVYLVAYSDEFGLYAQAFSSRAAAEAFVASFSQPDDFVIIETVVDRSLVLTKEPTL
jgi:hypothetical protein